jgi:hypothetical protein
MILRRTREMSRRHFQEKSEMGQAFDMRRRQHYAAQMCNLYSLTKGQQAIREAARAMRDVSGNLPTFPGIFPDYAAPIVRNAPDGVRVLSLAGWDMPSPVFALSGRNSDPGVISVRNQFACYRRQASAGDRATPTSSSTALASTPQLH